jgi:TonB family protein
VARLLLGRAELPGGGAEAMDRLMEVVKDAQGIAGIDAEAYPAAIELAVSAYRAGRYPLSAEAWVASVPFAEGARVDVDFARAQAKLGEASARIMPIAKTPATAVRAPLREFEAIDALLAEAIDLVHDQAMRSEIGGELTRAQSVYGDAIALKSGLMAKLKSDQRGRWKQTPPKKQESEIGVVDDSGPPCARKLVAKPVPTYPPARLVIGGVGSVVLKILLDEAGTVSRVQVAGTAGGPEFAKSVFEAARRWRVEREEGAAPGCRMAGEFFISVTFVFS